MFRNVASFFLQLGHGAIHVSLQHILVSEYKLFSNCSAPIFRHSQAEVYILLRLSSYLSCISILQNNATNISLCSFISGKDEELSVVRVADR
jgi:hypothetical protein